MKTNGIKELVNKAMKNERIKISHNIGTSGWAAISFTAGCFGFGWGPFIIIMGLFLLRDRKRKINK